MGLARENLRLQAYFFLLAVPLHLTWEVAQISAYDFPEAGLVKNAIGCFLPSLGDGLMTLMIYWGGWLVFRESHWILSPGAMGYLFMLAAGLILAVAVEWNALYRTGAWAYGEEMFLVPGLGVGFLPVLQMLILPPLTAFLLQWLWKKRKQAT